MARPPFAISLTAAARLGRIERLLGTWEGALETPLPEPHLRRANRVRTVVDTVGIEGNTFSLVEATATRYRFRR
jgi:hypothetical protein